MVLTYIKYYYLRGIIQKGNFGQQCLCPLQMYLVNGWFTFVIQDPRLLPYCDFAFL